MTWTPDSWRTPVHRNDVPVKSDELRAAVEDCLRCSMSGHWPLDIAEAKEFAESLDEEKLRTWLGFRCCGFKNQGIVGYLQGVKS